MVEEVEDLWEGLNLGGLLNDLARENESALAQAKKMQAKKDPFRKHNEMLRNPAYSVLMDRYGAAPPKPKLLAKATLSRLADPLGGRQQGEDRPRVVRETKQHATKHSENMGAAKERRRREQEHSPIRKEAWADTSRSPVKAPRHPDVKERQESQTSNFFLTGTNDEGEDYKDDFESAPPSPSALVRRVQQQHLAASQQQQHSALHALPRASAYTPPDIYSPRTKEALRASFQKESNEPKEEAPPSKKSMNMPIEKSKKKKGKVSRGKGKVKGSGKVAALAGAEVVTGGRTRGAQPPAAAAAVKKLKKKKAPAPLEDELNFDAPSHRVQLLSNKLKATSKANGARSSSHMAASASEGALRSSSVKGARHSNITDGQTLAGSRSAPSLKRVRHPEPRQSALDVLPDITEPAKTSLPVLRAKNLLGRRAAAPALQKHYAEVLAESKESAKASGLGFSQDKRGARANKTVLRPIAESSRPARKVANIDEAAPQLDAKLNKKGNSKSTESSQLSPSRVPAGASLVESEGHARKEEQEKKIEMRAQAFKKKEEMEFRHKIRLAAEENAKLKGDRSIETVDDKLVQMFQTHCAKLSAKISEADKFSSDFKMLREYDGYSIHDRLKMRPPQAENDATISGPDSAFLPKQLIV